MEGRQDDNYHEQPEGQKVSEDCLVPRCAAEFAPWRVECLWSPAAENTESSPAPSFQPPCIYSEDRKQQL